MIARLSLIAVIFERCIVMCIANDRRRMRRAASYRL